jgi:hypothetical protein
MAITLLDLYNLAQVIDGEVKAEALESTLINIGNTVGDVLAQVATNEGEIAKVQQTVDSILSVVNTLQANLGNDVASLIEYIRACQQAGQPVTLPSPAPSGYGGGTGVTAADVWAYVEVGQGQPMGYWMVNAGSFATKLGPQILPRVYDTNIVGLIWDWANPAGADPPLTRPILPVSDIRSDDTIGTWANRNWGSGGDWIQTTSGAWRDDADFPTTYGAWQILLTDAEFAELKALNAGASTLNVAPVWPGLANVTLGAIQALADGLLIPGPLDGVIVKITSVPYPISFYPFGPIKSFVRAGAVAFVDDNGEAEFPAPLGPQDEVICPRTMVRAAHAYLRLPSGVVGTIQPWLKT